MLTKLTSNTVSTIGRFFTVLLLPALFAACSDTDEEIIPTGQFDDGTYEIFGSPQESLGLIFAHKGTTIDTYSASYEIWAVNGSYCSSDKLDPTTMQPCSYKSLTFKYVGAKRFAEWQSLVNDRKFNNARYYRATYQARPRAHGLMCGSTSCTFESQTTWSSSVSMFPANKIIKSTNSSLPTVVVQQTGSGQGTVTTETWYMKAFFNNTPGDAGFIGESGFTFSDVSDTKTAMTPVDCAICMAEIQVDVKYKPCATAPLNESDMGCTEKK